MTRPQRAARPFALPELKDATVIAEHHDAEPKFGFHYHPLFELTLLRGSAGKRLIGDEITSYSRRDLALVGPNLPHSWAFEPIPPTTDKRDYIVVFFSRESIGLQLLSKPEMQPIRTLLDAAAQGLAFEAATIDRVEADIEALTRSEGFARTLIFLGILHKLSSPACFRTLVSKGYCPPTNQRDYSLLAQALIYIQENNHQPISLTDISHLVGMSIPSFTRFFKRMTGKTFVTYLNHWRVRRACILLQETDQSVLNISATVGFNNLSHFNRQFLRVVGCSPRAYRKSRPMLQAV